MKAFSNALRHGHTPGIKAYDVVHLRMPSFLAELACSGLIGVTGVAAAKKSLLCMQSE